MYERSLIGYENYSNNLVTRTGFDLHPVLTSCQIIPRPRVTNGLAYKCDKINGCASSRPVARKMNGPLCHVHVVKVAGNSFQYFPRLRA